MQNKIRIIENLDTLTGLTMLELGSNRIRELQNMDHLTALQKLWLGRNRITCIKNIESLVNLRCLGLQSNRIVTIQGLEKLVHLEELYISNNGITRLEGLATLTCLQTLDVAANRIAKIENLASCHDTLQEFWCNDNQIASFDDLSELTGARALQTVYLERNPVASHPQYRNIVYSTLRQLTQIDAIPVTRSSMLAAMQMSPQRSPIDVQQP